MVCGMALVVEFCRKVMECGGEMDEKQTQLTTRFNLRTSRVLPRRTTCLLGMIQSAQVIDMVSLSPIRTSTEDKHLIVIASTIQGSKSYTVSSVAVEVVLRILLN